MVRIAPIIAAGVFLVAYHPSLSAVPVTATDFGSLSLGAQIVGPVGPEVETTISFLDGGGSVVGIADLISSVSCDDRFADCSAAGVAGFNDVVYTYRHQVIPGVDLPNDPPFGDPDSVVPFDGVTEFRLQFEAFGFLGVAGFDFAQATAAIGSTNIGIDFAADGSIVWTLPSGSGWDTGEPLTFFWQTTQRPSGPGGVYGASNGALTGTGRGPLPSPIPEPSTVVLIVLGGAGLGLRRLRRAQNTGGPRGLDAE